MRALHCIVLQDVAVGLFAEKVDTVDDHVIDHTELFASLGVEIRLLMQDNDLLLLNLIFPSYAHEPQRYLLLVLETDSKEERLILLLVNVERVVLLRMVVYFMHCGVVMELVIQIADL